MVILCNIVSTIDRWLKLVAHGGPLGHGGGSLHRQLPSSLTWSTGQTNGRIFSLWSIPIDLVRQRSCLERLLRSPHGPPLFWLYMLLKEPRSRIAFSESAVSASSGTPLRAVCQNAVGAALKAWSDIPDVTCLQHATGSSVCSASYDGTII